MGVVRREGDWRLEKEAEGVYVVTFRSEPDLKIRTPDHSPGMFDEHGVSMVPVREVSSYSEAEGLFEEHANGGRSRSTDNIDPVSMDVETDLPDRDISIGDDGENVRLPPGGIALVLLFAGGIYLYTAAPPVGSLPFGIGGAFVGVGFLIFGWGIVIYHTRSLEEALEFLVTTSENDGRSSESEQEAEKTPPTPERLKNELFFERASQTCEWCGDDVDQPEVHHIVPRSEGGPNDPQNLIVLCPNCHRKADAGAISKSKLKAKVRRTMEAWNRS